MWPWRICCRGTKNTEWEQQGKCHCPEKVNTEKMCIYRQNMFIQTKYVYTDKICIYRQNMYNNNWNGPHWEFSQVSQTKDGTSRSLSLFFRLPLFFFKKKSRVDYKRVMFFKMAKIFHLFFFFFTSFINYFFIPKPLQNLFIWLFLFLDLFSCKSMFSVPQLDFQTAWWLYWTSRQLYMYVSKLVTSTVH